LEWAQTVPISHGDDKKQLTEVLAVMTAGDYLSPACLAAAIFDNFCEQTTDAILLLLRSH